MMEVSCAPCPPGPTSLPLSSSSSPACITTVSSTTTTTTTTTAAACKQGKTSLKEVSPDSGNGEDLDEFDPLKSPVTVSVTKCESETQADGLKQESESHPLPCSGRNPKLESSPSAAHNARGQGQAEGKRCDTDTCDRKESEMIAYMTEKPDLFRLSPQPEQLTSDKTEWQTGKQSDLPGGGTCARPIRGTYYSPAFNLRPLHSSLLVSCSQPFQCGPFSSPCGAIGNPRKGTEDNGLFSLPEGGDDMLDASLFSKSYLLGDNGRTCIKPFSLVSKEETEHFRKHTSNCCDTSYSLGAPQQVKTVRNPEYPRCLRSRPARRYTNPEVVRKQPTSGGLMTTSCDLMASPPGQCACVNPGTSHACVTRLSGKYSLGMLNPMFDADYSSKQETHTAVPSSPRKFSLDHGSKAKCSGNADICRSHPPNTCFFSLLEEPPTTKQSLSKNSREPLRRASESSSGTSSQGHLPPSSTSPEDLASKNAASAKKASLPAKLESLGSVLQPQSKRMTSKSEAFAPENILRNLDSISCATQGDGSAKNPARSPMVTSPDWINFLTPPSQEAYTQSLFTPDNLHDELFYPAPYGLKSEVYQNLNAREADFVLQKPNRKPRTEPLPPSCVPVTAPLRPESPDLQDGIIPPLATEDEEALQEGARESRKASLKERRKSSLEKIYIPKPSEAIDPILNVKIDNFDREEYVKYKKTLSESDSYISERLKFATKGKQNSQDSDSSNTSDNRVVPSSQELLKLEALRAKKNDEMPTKATSLPTDDTHENLQKKEVIHENTPQKDRSHSRKDTFLPREMLNGKLRSHKQILPKQRSLEENETANKANAQKTVRKQSLPTEELFGIRRNQHMRKFSLHQLMSHPAQVSVGGAAFSPVNEGDEAQTLMSTTSKKKDSDISFPLGKNERDISKVNMKYPNTKSETRVSGRKASHLDKDGSFLATPARPLSSDSSLSPYKGTSTTGKKNRNIQRRSNKQSDSPHHNHHHHHHHHQSKEDAHRRPHRTENLRRRPRKSSSSPADDRGKKQKPAAHRSPRKVPRELRRTAESHTNLGAPLSPPEQEASGDLFTNRRCSLQSKQASEVRPAVPYEPLVDALTPTTPDDPPAASGATR